MLAGLGARRAMPIKRELSVVRRSEAEYLQYLGQQYDFLKVSGKRFDQGADHEAVRLAVILRVLLHTPRSLLHLLGALPQLEFEDSTSPPQPNLTTVGELIGVQVRWDGTPRTEAIPIVGPPGEPGVGRRTVPLLDSGLRRRTPFPEWWRHKVLSAPGAQLSRNQLVVAVANNEGGSHVDAEGDKHLELAKNSSWFAYEVDGHLIALDSRDVWCTMRQIAHEVQRTLQREFAF